MLILNLLENFFRRVSVGCIADSIEEFACPLKIEATVFAETSVTHPTPHTMQKQKQGHLSRKMKQHLLMLLLLLLLLLLLHRS